MTLHCYRQEQHEPHGAPKRQQRGSSLPEKLRDEGLDAGTSAGARGARVLGSQSLHDARELRSRFLDADVRLEAADDKEYAQPTLLRRCAGVNALASKI